MQDKPEWCELIQQTLVRQGRSQAWLARELDLPDDTLLSHILSGRRAHLMTEAMKAKIADLLFVPYGALFHESKPVETNKQPA